MKIKLLVVGPLLTNCYLLNSENELLIIDPGGEVEKILEEIRKIKGKPKYVINTHCHPDHISANEKVKKETGAKILTDLKEGEEIKIGDNVLKIIHTPGHTRDSICLVGRDFIFTGDTLFKDGYGRTDLPGGSQKDLEASLEKIEKILIPGMLIYPGHGEIFKTNV